MSMSSCVEAGIFACPLCEIGGECHHKFVEDGSDDGGLVGVFTIVID